MLTHERIWASIDALAKRYSLSPSGLARKAGLDATSFNKSKRTSVEGRDRWPSTESISKILRATGASFEEFIHLVEPEGRAKRSTLALASFDNVLDDKFLTKDGVAPGDDWDEVEFPDFNDDEVFAIEVEGESLEPLYRDGDVLIVSPETALRKGDRVLLCTNEGEILGGELKRRTAKTLELRPFGTEEDEKNFSRDDIKWYARIMWARQ